MPSPADWRVRAFKAGDEPGLVALFRRVYGRPRSEADFRWKLETLPSPVENVFLAEAGDRLVFHNAGIPTRVWLAGREVLAMVAVDAMTDPDFQRRGLLTAVARHTYDAWRDAGVAFVLGLPNERWGSRTGALGWRKLFGLEWLLHPLRPEAILAERVGWPPLARIGLAGSLWKRYASLRSPRDPSVVTRELSSAGAELDRLWREARPGLTISPVRDAAWVAWRYLGAPEPYRVLLAERGGAPVGYAAFRLVAGRLGTLPEVFFADADPGAGRTLLAEALARLDEAGATRVVALAIPGTPFHELLKDAGFLARGKRFEVEMVPLAADLPLELAERPGSWCLHGGDFDVI